MSQRQQAATRPAPEAARLELRSFFSVSGTQDDALGRDAITYAPQMGI